MDIKIAIIIPWFGQELKGGAEQHAWQTANRLAQRGSRVTVLTTCSREFLSDWSENYYAAGDYQNNKILIKRFTVKKRNAPLFDRINAKLLSINKQGLIPGVSPISRIEEEIYLNENIYSEELLRYIESQYAAYDAFIFIPYLFTSAIKGIKLAKDKAVLQPCLHNECYAYLDSVGDAFYHAQKIFFISEGEFELAKELYGKSITSKSCVTGAGVEMPAALLKEYCIPPLLRGDYILCLGRRDVGKNTHLIIDAFDDFIQQTGSALQLVLAGPAPLPVKPKTKNIIDMGLVAEEEKMNLLHHCKALINPSINESFSRVIFEAWFAGKPVIVNSKCLATYKALERSGFAGWSADCKETFIDIFKTIAHAPVEEIKALGEKGYAYTDQTANWDRVIERYIEEISSFVQDNNRKKTVNAEFSSAFLKHKKKIVLMYIHIGNADAVGHDVSEEYFCLKEQGVEAYLYADSFEDVFSAHIITEQKLLKLMREDDTMVIYHHANYWEKGEELIKKAQCTVYMKYHNITPAEYFERYTPSISESCRRGRDQTERLIREGVFDFYVADSPYNAQEIEKYGVPQEKITVLAPFHKINAQENVFVNSELLEHLSDGKINVLFVGRIAPNKRHIDLIETIREYTSMYDRNIRLNIIGGMDINLQGYFEELMGVIEKYGLTDVVYFKRTVPLDILTTYYRASNIFLLMSEHEGFCVPILEAQYNKLPVIALDRCAVRNTLGEEQIIFNELDYKNFATAIHVIAGNHNIRKYLSARGYENYLKYERNTLARELFRIIGQATN